MSLGKRVIITKIPYEFMGGKDEISAPSLVMMFQSEKLFKSFQKVPTTWYSVNEVINLIDDCFQSYFRKEKRAGTLRSAVKAKKDVLFDIRDDFEIRKRGLTRVMVFKFRPICNDIFRNAEKLKKELKN